MALPALLLATAALGNLLPPHVPRFSGRGAEAVWCMFDKVRMPVDACVHELDVLGSR